MAVNQAKIFEQLELLTKTRDSDDFIHGFLTAFDFPKATITQLKQGSSRNVATEPNHIALKNKLYYFPAKNEQDLDILLDERVADPLIARNKIRFVLTTDFERLVAWDTATSERLSIDFEVLHSNYSFFLPLVGLEKAILNSENPADVKAAMKMGKLFDLIKINNQIESSDEIHALNVFLTRLLFCLFAEDTGIFSQKAQFTHAIKSYTHEDGSDIDVFLADLFAVMNCPNNGELRKKLPKHLTDFPYVNGGLFDKNMPIPELGKKGRRILIECGQEDWSAINPDIFGSMFQAVIDVEQRARLGQHYTSYSNIMKIIQPLFLEPLKDELEKQRNNAKGLKKLLVRLGQIKVFDPACGSGNFLIIAYKELRLFEIEVIKALQKLDPSFFMSGIHLNQFYGIEIDDFACEVARLSLWIAEHQINKEWEASFGHAEPLLPLKASGNIVSGNSLRLDWHEVCPKQKDDEVYVIGNPPFLGTLGRTDEQRADMQAVFEGFKALGGLDFVACWFYKGAQYIQNSNAELAFVATNSICQGEQVGVLWPPIFGLGLNIHLAYPTFSWANNARDKAAVHVIIVGLSALSQKKQLFQKVDEKWHCQKVNNISPYLVIGGNTVATGINKPFLNDTLPLIYGNKPTDGGYLFLNSDEKKALINLEPQAERWIKRVLGSSEFLNSKERYCLWLVELEQTELEKMPYVHERVRKVAETRRNSPDKGAHKLAEKPHLFRDTLNPDSYILIPRVSSERRKYIPIGFFDSNTIATDRNYILPNGTMYDFAILTSLMHNDWMRLVAMRLKSDYSYGNKVVYNTFPWPTVTDQQKEEISQLAEEILLTREDFVGKTLAELYNPESMPPTLLAAHQALDAAVDKLYRAKPFKDSSERLSHLLGLYEKLVQQHEAEKASKPKKTRSKKAEVTA